jgi:glc operon protein GlcG
MDTDRALQLIVDGRQLAHELGMVATIAVVDAAGHPVALARGKSWHGPYLAFGKARLAAAFRKPTAALLEQWKDRPLFAQSLTEVIPQGVTLNPGGYPIFDGDECIGAFGVGGGSPDQDEELARRIVQQWTGDRS